MGQQLQTMTVRINANDANGRGLLAPMGLSTPHTSLHDVDVSGADFTLVTETTTGQSTAFIAPEALTKCDEIVFSYTYVPKSTPYPSGMFQALESKYTTAAQGLIHDIENLPRVAQGGMAAIEAIISHTAHRFSYGHPDIRFNDGLNEVPSLGCGLTEGSCIDINTYLIAALRAADIEAGYITGGFFPAEKQGVCDDMHCWVVTRHGGRTLEWDIAHHLKLGTRMIAPGLNPKAGERVALYHSMGLEFPRLGLKDLKLLAEPLWIGLDGTCAQSTPAIKRTTNE